MTATLLSRGVVGAAENLSLVVATVTRKKCRTLIVEDDPDSAKALSMILSRLGHETAIAETLARGRALLDDWSAECVLLDLNLPDGNGIALLREIARDRKPIPVIVTTASNDPRLLREAETLGAIVLQKPIDLNRLIAELERFEE